jgi:HSP20 family protein
MEEDMAIMRFDPLRDLAILQDRMNRLFNDSYGTRREEDLMSRGTWTPPVDIYEVDGALVIKAELPGLQREDIDVHIENHTLTIRGERKLDAAIKQENFHRVERAYGSFTRSFSLPNTVDAAKVAAEFKNGVLSVTLPVREEAKPRTINIDVAA